MRALAFVLAFAASTASADLYNQDVVIRYCGQLGTVGHHNGVMGLGQWLIYGHAPELCDANDGSGLRYPWTPNVFGQGQAGAFSVHSYRDNQLVPIDVVKDVRFRVRVKFSKPSGNRLQTFVHRDVPGTLEGEDHAWGDLTWQSSPLLQSPTSPPYLPRAEDAPWIQNEWTWITGYAPRTGAGGPWTVSNLYQNSFGIWVQTAVGGEVQLSEWELLITVSRTFYDTCPGGCVRTK